MRHLSLWLDKYSRRRAEILTSWSCLTRTVEGLRSRLPIESLFLPLKKAESTDELMAFVDGGEGIRELLGLGVYFIRASGLMLSNTDAGRHGELFVRDLDMNVIDYDDHTKERVEMLRDCMEFDVAIRCVEQNKPAMMFLDGSLYVKARRNPIECPEYELYRKKYVRLLKLCKKEGIRLAGVSEDSKSRMLAQHLSNQHKVKFPRFMTDSTILKLLAREGSYRTMEFMPKSRFEAGYRIEEGIVAGFPTAYMQPNELSNPLRIDVPDWETDIGGVISTIASLCDGSGYYGYPLPLYIAHLDARVTTGQMDWTARQIVSYVSKRDSTLAGAVMKATRRTMRPE